ncbi:pre-mRNA-processing ATP-dependent RNA helicase PRP5-like [Phoenix dactylifera]|uniref:Pre-mRNA-processing ATP-dependent RNA helicase PRP5-like n=1 Tax=Phoenix dactylifera TaxID=42345 RepID=A0A8B9AP36_PHODC|nr:pre-mRNA-processing ATP-dependent RNA helicase PRP5-like [Phoenix dactylifera]XP_038988532.1 pre-mRNA-processing ATP-dependent RNA helicase PRP5-like [Phoenix dactylifera]
MVCPPMGLNMGYDDDQHERGRTEFYSSRRMEEPMMLPQQPLARSQQDMRMSHQFIPPGHSGGLNMLPQHPLPNMYSHAAFPNPAALRPPLGMLGSSDFPNISSADAYRRHHEVTAMGDNVPAPFMTFESTGFPPEILREMHLAGFLSPTPIQAQTWPVALQKRDVVAIAKTGSGKTLAVFTPTATRDEELSIEESSQAIIFRENSDSAVVQPENSAHMSAEISASAPIVSENAEESLTSEIPATEGRSTSVIATEASANAAKEQGDFTVDLQLQREDTPVADFSAENSATAKFVAPPRSSGFLPDSSNHIEPIHSQEDAKITTRAVINIQRPTTMQLTAWIDRYEEPKRKFGTFRKGTIGKGML